MITRPYMYSESSHIRNGWGQHHFRYVKFSDMWNINLYTPLSTCSSSARRIILCSFEHTERLSIDETNDRILDSFFFRLVTIELPIPNSLATLVPFSPTHWVCSTCFLAIEQLACVAYTLRQPFLLLSMHVWNTHGESREYYITTSFISDKPSIWIKEVRDMRGFTIFVNSTHLNFFTHYTVELSSDN